MTLYAFLRAKWHWLLLQKDYWSDYFRGRHIFQMWGRVFDLSSRKLVSLDGFSLYVIPDDYIGRSILESGHYEPHVTSVIRNQLKKGDVFLDLGANIGYFTMLAAKLVGQSGKVIAVEPNPQNLQLIYASLLENQITNVAIYPYAVSDCAGILRFTTVGSNGGVITKYSKDQKHFMLVPALTIDEMLKDIPQIDLIKIDIEAHEPAAIRGMEKVLRRLKPMIITEFHPWAMRLNNADPPEVYLQQLEDLGYRFSVIKSSGELVAMSSPQQVLKFWQSLQLETAHLDLIAQSKD